MYRLGKDWPQDDPPETYEPWLNDRSPERIGLIYIHRNNDTNACIWQDTAIPSQSRWHVLLNPTPPLSESRAWDKKGFEPDCAGPCALCRAAKDLIVGAPWVSLAPSLVHRATFVQGPFEKLGEKISTSCGGKNNLAKSFRRHVRAERPWRLELAIP